MTAQELIAKVLELEEGVCHSCRQHKYLSTAKKVALMLQKAIEQRNYFMTQSGFRDGKSFEMRKLRENAELDRIARGEG